jgi:hypothetical protein
MKLPPAYSIQERDDVYVPERQAFKDAFRVLSLPLLSSKVKETAFQILNRMVLFNNKAFKSGLQDSPLCSHCEETKSMEHLLYLHMSQLLRKSIAGSGSDPDIGNIAV